MRWFFFVVGLLWGVGAVAGECRDDRVDVRFSGSSVRFTVEIADTPQERALGLMHRDSLGQFAGMLFVFEQPRPLSFWMKDTLIPLDMLFIDAKGIVQHIHENAVPLSRESIPGGDNLQYVLEINGGLAAMLRIEPGAVLRHPAISPELAIWPCE